MNPIVCFLCCTCRWNAVWGIFALLLGSHLHAQVLEPPNIVWINCEDLDETLGCYDDAFAITPHLDALAEDSILYRNAFANAPICAPARACLISGLYPTSFGAQHLRCEVDLPESIRPFPLYLKEAGYFVTNYAKTDYNFSPDGIYDYWKKDMAPWRQRKGGKPFFSFFVFGTTHEGPANFKERYDQATASLPDSKRHDPNHAKVPPYFPDTPKMRELWARYYDLVSAMDEEVGQVIQGLKDDGLWENTIVWFFSDHGHGLPRHKRWLLDSGIRVPFMVRIPKQYQHLAAGQMPGSETNELVSFVDFAPTTLALAGVDVPPVMQGNRFLGEDRSRRRDYVFAARDRADDMFEISRTVHDGRHIYIRHFLPHLPYVQGGRIFGNQKESLVELRRAKVAGELNAVSSLMWSNRKPVEEFYDLESDPFEINNRIEDPAYAQKIESMREIMMNWMLEHHDTGMLHEAEYQLRALNNETTVFDMANDRSSYDLPSILQASWVATSSANEKQLASFLESPDSGIRFWGATGYVARQIRPDQRSLGLLKAGLKDKSPSVAIACAEVLCRNNETKIGLEALGQYIASDYSWVALQAARTLHDLGVLAKPLVQRMETVRKGLEGTDTRRRYRDFNYASFTGWALESALINCGAAEWQDFD